MANSIILAAAYLNAAASNILPRLWDSVRFYFPFFRCFELKCKCCSHVIFLFFITLFRAADLKEDEVP